MGYNEEDSGAPFAGTVSPEEMAAATQGLAERQNAAELLAKEKVVPETGLVSYVAAPEYAQKSFLIKAGEPQAAPIQMGTNPGIKPLLRREGDKWARFVGGTLVTDDPDIIAWCDAHPTQCRRSDDPVTRGWHTLKEMQTRRANRDQAMDASQMDAEASFPAGMKLSPLAEQAAKDDSPGGRAVAAAELSREAAERDRAEKRGSV